MNERRKAALFDQYLSAWESGELRPVGSSADPSITAEFEALRHMVHIVRTLTPDTSVSCAAEARSCARMLSKASRY
ncbi:MAG: hypothetical protein GX620_02200 [Chloroflexi bacterium]|nr:hypothetical protein [Chloroflexota bacterium]